MRGAGREAPGSDVPITDYEQWFIHLAFVALSSYYIFSFMNFISLLIMETRQGRPEKDD